MAAKNLFKASFFKALAATTLYAIVYIFYNIEIIREKAEDIAFDIINKLYIQYQINETQAPNVLLFSFDDIYMRTHHLYDEKNRSAYGYLFPRDHLANFIARLDSFVQNIEPHNRPKALFIDFDMRFTSLPYGKKLSIEDRKLIETLKKPRPYTIVLPKTSSYNFIQHSHDPKIQSLIRQRRIVFVSVPFLQDSEGVVRRYKSYEIFRENNSSIKYDNAALQLWKMVRDRNDNPFKKDDIVANRIFIKSYYPPIIEDECLMQKSRWRNLTKYSANCSFYDIVEEDFANAILLLGSTHTHNDDTFQVLDIFGSDSRSGIELHADTLMTMLHLNGPLRRLPLWQSLLIVFSLFFSISLVVSSLLISLHIYSEEIELIVVLIFVTLALIATSLFLLEKFHLWFNWFIPLILYELIEIYDIINSNIVQFIRRKDA